MQPPRPIVAETGRMKRATIPGRVAKAKLHRFAVSQPAFRYLENLVWNRACFIEEIERCAIRRMLAREGFRVFLPRGLSRTEPRRRKGDMIHSFAGHSEPAGRDAKSRPLLDLRPGLSTQLSKRIRGDRPLRVRPGGHDPVHEPRYEGRFPYAVTTRERAAQRRNRMEPIKAALEDGRADRRQHFRLPHVRTRVILERPRFAPWVGKDHEAERIRVKLADFVR